MKRVLKYRSLLFSILLLLLNSNQSFAAQNNSKGISKASIHQGVISLCIIHAPRSGNQQGNPDVTFFENEEDNKVENDHYLIADFFTHSFDVSLNDQRHASPSCNRLSYPHVSYRYLVLQVFRI
ncbi:MAG TPA: hypothetical protein VFE57_07800 [Cyclobacteriaceae bacterium]|nr:hypothetical protein [Cyclobacteriaceae bacterium]